MEYFYYEEITRYWETSIKLMREHHSDSDIQMDQRRLKHSSFTASLNIERGQRMRARAWVGEHLYQFGCQNLLSKIGEIKSFSFVPLKDFYSIPNTSQNCLKMLFV